jgi:hypothetical protein
MDDISNSPHRGFREVGRGVNMGALLALAVVLVLAAAGAGVLVAGAFLVAGA